MSPEIDEATLVIRGELARKFGRCVLRLQEYEHLLKRLLSVSEFSVTKEGLHAATERRQAAIAKVTLGQLIKEFTGSVLKSGIASTEDVEEAPLGSDGCQVATASLKIEIQLSVDAFDKQKQTLSELVELRNRLVHHFLADFDLRVGEGIRQADAYLDRSWGRIDAQYRDLFQLAREVDALLISHGQALASPDVEDMLDHGIMPNGQGVQWAGSTIVEYLRDAEDRQTPDRWTRLSSAIEVIRARDPAQTPKRYGCSSWRQVLYKSELFEVRKTHEGCTGETVVWYRFRSH